MREYIISDNDAGQRFDKYLAKLLKNAPSGLIYKQLRGKNITLNQAKAKGSEKLEFNDLVRIYMADATIDKFMGNPEKIDVNLASAGQLMVVYEDDNILIADKQPGILSQKARPDDVSMNELLLSYLVSAGQNRISDTFTPAFCNRLDRNTSGLMIAGISLAGSQKMSELIRNRDIEKYYLAIVFGRMQQGGRVNGYITKDTSINKVTISNDSAAGDYIDTEYEPLAQGDEVTLMKIRLITGKTHQIRAQMAGLGYPLVGDIKYGTPKSMEFSRQKGIKRQLLHSYELVFPELDGRFANISGMTVRSGYPEDFKRFFDGREQRT